MAAFRIVCTTQAPADRPPSHQHIVGVGTGVDPDKADRGWTLAQVLVALDEGHTFYTFGIGSHRRAEVQKYWCASCSRWFIRSKADAVVDNNLDNLRRCNWKA